MKLTRFLFWFWFWVLLLGTAVLFTAASANADGLSMPDLFPHSHKESKNSDFTNTLKRINAGTKRFIRGTVDVITLRPLWDNKKTQREPYDPWMRQTRKQAEKKPFWNSWLTPKEEPKRAATVGEWVGLERPE